MSKNLLSRLSDNEAIKEIVCKLLKECKPEYNDFQVDRSIKIQINEVPITIHPAGDLLVKNADGLNLLYIKISVWDTPFPDDDKEQALAYARSLSEENIPPFTILMDEERTRMYDTFTGDQMESNSISTHAPCIQNGFGCSGDIPELQEEALTYFESLTPENLFSFCNEQFESKSQLFHSHTDTRPCDDTEMGEIDKILREVGQDPLSLNWVYTYVENIIALQIDEKQFIEELAELILSGVSTEDNKEGREKAEFWIKLLLKIDEEFDTFTSFDDTLVYQFYEEEIYHCFETDWYTLDIFIKLIFDEDPKISKNALATAVRGYPLFLFENMEAILSYYSQYNRPGVKYLKEEICNKYLDVLQEQYHGGPYCGGWFPETEKGDEYAKEEYEKQKEAWWPILKTLPPSSRLYCRIKEMLSELAEFLTEEDKDLRMLP